MKKDLPIRIFLLMVAASLVLGTSGCSGDPENDTEAGLTGYQLDPPDLASGEFPPVEDGVPVFCYHYFRSGFNPGYLVKVLGSVIFGMPALGPREFWTTPVGEFEKHLRYFRDTGTVVMTLDEVADLVEAGRDLPPRAVVLTIDDADLSVYELAWPLLRKYGMKAHLFVPTAKVGDAWSDLKVCTWEQLAEMEASGTIIVESHTRDLHYKVRTDDGLQPVFFHPERISVEARQHNLNDLARQARTHPEIGRRDHLGKLLAGFYGPVAADLATSRTDIQAGAGARASWLAWPYGFANDALDSLGREVGFRGTVSLRPRAFTGRDSTLQVGRFAVTAKTTREHIAKIYGP